MAALLGDGLYPANEMNHIRIMTDFVVDLNFRFPGIFSGF
jgi:hypothetical protein